MSTQRPRTSPLLVTTIGAVVIGLGGYAAWSLLRPDPYLLSERIVRDKRRELSDELRDFQRSLGQVARQGKAGGQEAVAAIDKHAADVMAAIDEHVEEAHRQLLDLDIAVRIQRNRLDRIRARAQEAKEMVEDLAEEARAKVRGE